MTAGKSRPYRGASADERRARRRAALLDAGLELIATVGRTATTVRGVCAKAALNDRYFYESFTDLDALLLAIYDDVARRGEEAILNAARSAPRDLRSRVRAVVTGVVDFLTADPRHAGLLVHEIQSDPVLQQRRQVLVRRLVGIFREQTHEIFDEVTLSDTDIELTALTLIGGSMEVVGAWLRGELTVGRRHLIDFIVALMLTSADLSSALDREVRAAAATGTVHGGEKATR